MEKLSVLLFSGSLVSITAKAEETKYIDKVKSMKRKVLANPHPNGNGLSLEGWGLIASAIVLGNFYLKGGYEVFNSADDFGSDRHPKRSIKRPYLNRNTRKAPAKSDYDAM